MPHSLHNTLPPLSEQLQTLIQEGWEQEVLSQLPADYEQQARQTGAFCAGQSTHVCGRPLTRGVGLCLVRALVPSSGSAGGAHWPGQPVSRRLAEALAASAQLPVVAALPAVGGSCLAEPGADAADRAHRCHPTQRTRGQWRRLARASGLRPRGGPAAGRQSQRSAHRRGLHALWLAGRRHRRGEPWLLSPRPTGLRPEMRSPTGRASGLPPGAPARSARTAL